MQKNIYPLILAGKRSNDILCEEFNLSNKAFLSVAQKPLISHVVDAIGSNHSLQEPLHISYTQGQEDIFNEFFSEHHHELNIKFVENKINASLVQACTSTLQLIKQDDALLITTADNGLLDEEILSYFLKECRKSPDEILIGVVNGKEHKEHYNLQNNIKRTWHKINKDTWLSGANLFYWPKSAMNPQIEKVLTKLEKNRKSPLGFCSIVANINLLFLLKFALSKSSLEECNKFLSKVLGASSRLYILPFWQACIDVDKPADFHFVEEYLQKN